MISGLAQRLRDAFVGTAILIFGHALLKAPDFVARRYPCGILHGLGCGQLGYFDSVIKSLKVTARGPLPASVTAFDASRFANLSGLFGHALRLEIDFHTAPYESVTA